MRVVSVTALMAIVAFTFCLPNAFAGQRSSKVHELISLHDLETSVSIGNYYLKQESLVSIRRYLAQLGRDQKLGENWHAGNAWWRQAEESLLERMMHDVDAEFSSLEWLRPQWTDLFTDVFSEEEIDALVLHFRTDVGAKQVRIIDHTVSTHVMMTLSFSGKLKSLPGIENERARMQQLWNDEDERMRFPIQGAANAEGQAFALSPLGKKYFTTAILNLTGIVNQRLGEIAMQRPGHVQRFGETVRPYVEGFKRDSA